MSPVNPPSPPPPPPPPKPRPPAGNAQPAAGAPQAPAGRGGAADNVATGGGDPQRASRLGLPGASAPQDPSKTTYPPMPFSNEEISQKLGVPIENVNKYVPELAKAMQAHGVTDRASAIAILATIKVETGSFQPIPEEGGGAQYEGRADLGNTQPGDGNRFMGRGFVQLTGRANYSEYGQKLGVDLVGHPELALDPKVSSEIMVQYCVDHNIPALAQQGDWQGVRRAVNGGLNGWDTFSQSVQALNGGAALPMTQSQNISGGGASGGSSSGGSSGGAVGGSSGGGSAGGAAAGGSAAGGASGGDAGGASGGASGGSSGTSAPANAASPPASPPSPPASPADEARVTKDLGLAPGALTPYWSDISSLLDGLSEDERAAVLAMIKAALKGVDLKNPKAVAAALAKVKHQMGLAGMPSAGATAPGADPVAQGSDPTAQGTDPTTAADPVAPANDPTAMADAAAPADAVAPTDAATPAVGSA